MSWKQTLLFGLRQKKQWPKQNKNISDQKRKGMELAWGGEEKI